MLNEAELTRDGTNPKPNSDRLILLADDEPMLRSVLSEFIETIPGFIVAEANDGVEALDYIRHNDVDILLSDMSMPRMGLDELLEVVTREFPLIAVIGTSGFSDFDDTKRLLLAGAQDFLPKPLNLNNLEHTLNFIFARGDILAMASEAFGSESLELRNGGSDSFQKIEAKLNCLPGARGLLMRHASRTAALAGLVYGDESPADLAELRLASLLHEIGSTTRYLTTIAEPRGLLPQELAFVRAQFCVGARLVEKALPERKASAIISEHPNWITMESPSGNEGEGDQELSRRLGILNAVDALAHSRADRGGLSKEDTRRAMDGLYQQTRADALLQALDLWPVIEEFYAESWQAG